MSPTLPSAAESPLAVRRRCSPSGRARFRYTCTASMKWNRRRCRCLGVAGFVRRQLPAITLTPLLGSAAATQSLTRQVNAVERLGFGVGRACADAITYSLVISSSNDKTHRRRTRPGMSAPSAERIRRFAALSSFAESADDG